MTCVHATFSLTHLLVVSDQVQVGEITDQCYDQKMKENRTTNLHSLGTFNNAYLERNGHSHYGDGR